MPSACRRNCSAPTTTFRATSAAPSTPAGSRSSTPAPAWTGSRQQGYRAAGHPGHQPGFVRGVHRRGARPARPGGHLQPRLDVFLRRGLDRPFHPARARRASASRSARTICGATGRVISPASYLERLQGRDMQSLLIWARHDSTFPAGLFAAGAEELPRAGAAAPGLHPALRPLHHRAVPVQPDGRAGDVPFRRAEPVTAILHIV